MVEVKIVLPEVLDERSKELMRELAELSTDDVRSGLWPSGVAHNRVQRE